ncbi:N-acetylglucosamine-6-phosphate deacetylase [Bacillus rossius redtenbacheri]|uniref:N-acetylglucosamine-6-phosphate deacetylase n=1 Tax=Bacillus rossius redtenbacheri TaxID=93214 RepID=UPI002FDE657A
MPGPRMPQLIKFKNCRILRNSRIFEDDIWVREGKIIDPEKVFFDEKNCADVQVDCQGAIVSPGFIELQINGAFGIDFSQNENNVEEGVSKVAKGLLAHGVTAFCPTVVTSPKHMYHQILPRLRKRPGGPHGATVLGVHVEGPFINVEKKGAHPDHCIRGLDKGFETLSDVYGSLDNFRIVTLAPELENAMPVIEELTKRGILVSLGHSVSDLQCGEEAVGRGANFITHLFNAMLPFHHRDPGLVGLLASERVPQPVYYGIIADGIHTHPAALRIAHRTSPQGVVLVTDAISAMGLEEGTHTIGQMTVEVRGDRAVLAGTDTLCGSIASMVACLRTFRGATSCSLVEALEAATLHPARALGIQGQKGTLDFGADADFVFLDEALNLSSTWIAGECVFRHGARPC